MPYEGYRKGEAAREADQERASASIANAYGNSGKKGSVSKGYGKMSKGEKDS